MKTRLSKIMKRSSAVLMAVFASVPFAFSQDKPQIVWSTNVHKYLVGALAFSKDGAFLASGSLDSTGRVWRVSTRALVQSFYFLRDGTGGGISSFAFSPDNSLFAMGDGVGRFTIWRLPGAALVFASVYGINYSSTDALCFSPDGTLFGYAGIRPGVHINRTPDGSFPGLFTIPNFPYPEDGPVSRDMRFSPDGTWLALGFSDGTARIYRMAEGYEQRNLAGHSGEITSVDFSPDGRMLATTAADGDARLWSIPDGHLVRTLRGVASRTVDLYKSQGRFSADGKCLVTLSNETVRFWSVSDGRLLLTYPNLQAFSMAVSPDGKHFAYGTGSQIAATGTVVMARMPLLIADISRDNGQLILGWSGGGGRYQLQSTPNVATGPWQNVGEPTTATAATNPVANTIFYRVQNLPNP